MLLSRPGPSSTESGFWVRRTGSPTLTPAGRTSASHPHRPMPGYPARTCLLVDLDGSPVAADPDDLSDQTVVAHLDQLVHGHSLEVLGHHDRAGDRVNLSVMLHCGGSWGLCS